MKREKRTVYVTYCRPIATCILLELWVKISETRRVRIESSCDFVVEKASCIFAERCQRLKQPATSRDDKHMRAEECM